MITETSVPLTDLRRASGRAQRADAGADPEPWRALEAALLLQIDGLIANCGGTLAAWEAAHAVGATTPRIMSRHIVPNAIGPLIVAVTQGMGGAILAESSLSFLGIGVQPPNASWGSMLADSLELWRTFPHLMLVPAVTIGVIQVAFIFLGDGLNDAFNPRQGK